MANLDTALIFEREKLLGGDVAVAITSTEVLRRQRSANVGGEEPAEKKQDGAATGKGSKREPRRLFKILP